ncbi:nitronate monooxygenase [Amycolatopsis sp. TRM77291]
MHSTLAALGLSAPVLAAPMAGGPTTSRLVTAAAAAGGVGLLAGGYKTAEGLEQQIKAVRTESVPFGVNLFAPNPVPVDRAAYDQYVRVLQPEAERHGIDLTAIAPTEDDDAWHDKIDLLLTDLVPFVTFTFGMPAVPVIQALRKAGTIVGQTVTSVDEARLATEVGVDILIVQGSAAGGHSGTLTPERPPAEVPLGDLVRAVAAATDAPIIAAGGIATPDAVADILRAGAAAAMVGTVLLRSEESGTSPLHQAALCDPNRRRTVVTRAFTGRPARALANAFTDRYSALAPVGFPALHHLTSPLRKAAAAAGDPDGLNLWAGTGFRHAAAEPAAQILKRLIGD